MDVASHVKTFNNMLDEFYEDLLAVGNTELTNSVSMARMTTNVARASDPSTVPATFHKYVAGPYAAHIVKKNQDFFLGTNYQASTFDVVGFLRRCWPSLTADDQEAVWAHLQNLCKVSARIAGIAPGPGRSG